MAVSEVLPRTRVRTIESPPKRSVPLDGTRLLVAMEATRGTIAPMRMTKPADVAWRLERTGVGIPAFDAVDVAFRERVPEVFFARVLGDAPTHADIDLAGASGTSFTIAAVEPGEWANGAAGGLTAEVVNGPAGNSERVVIVRRAMPNGVEDVELGRTGAYTTRAKLMEAVERITRVELAAVAGTDIGLPSVAAAGNFTGGTADSGTITSENVRAALERVDPRWGPMWVAAPGRNTDATNTELLSYAAGSDRVALLEQAAGLSVGAIEASAATLRALGSGADGLARLGGMWAQHATGPGVVPGQTRSVPWTIIVAGLTARLEAQEGHPNVAPFGDFGVPLWATGLDREFAQADAEAIFSAGCNVAEVDPVLGVRNATFRTLEPYMKSEWVDLAHTRTERAILANARDVGRGMGSRVINERTLAELSTRFSMRLEALRKAEALHGDTPDEAYAVDWQSVNDADTMRAHEANLATGVAMSEHAEFVNIDIAKIAIGEV